MEYEPPRDRLLTTDGKFIRVGERVYVSDPKKTQLHDDVAREDELDGEIEKLKGEVPIEVDAGFITVSPVNVTDGGWIITLAGNSILLRLPIEPFAEQSRLRTKEVIQQLSPQCDVELDVRSVRGFSPEQNA